MSTSHELQSRLTGLRVQVTPLLAQIHQLEAELRDALSREWIAANNVKLEDVADPDEKGLPYFGHIKAFADYLRYNMADKKWCAWNGTIYNTAEILAGTMDHKNSPGKMEHFHP
mgnify:CR=1 FL=1